VGIRKAARAKIPTWGLNDLPGLDAGEVGRAGALVEWGDIRKPPPRTTECEIIEGDSVQEKVRTLVDRLMSEKVI